MAIELVDGFENKVAYYKSPIGLLKIVADARHINEVSFVDNEEQNVQPSQPNALLLRCIEQLFEYFKGQRIVFDLPIQQKGTDFQQKVWSQLVNIACGRTISYLTLAKQLGDPNCIRAAASSNGKNNIIIIVPCHRVIGSNDSLVGYSGGLWRKKWLLHHENKMVNGVQTLFN